MRDRADSLFDSLHRAICGRVIIFDTETTGMSNVDEICQIAAVEYMHGTLARSMDEYLVPSCRMNPWAEGAHGLSMEFLRRNGIHPANGLGRFVGFIDGCDLLVAHNLPFDLRMLKNGCVKYGVHHAWDGERTCDTLALARQMHPEFECHALWHLIDALGVDGTNSHDALDDARACAEVFFKLVNERNKKDG